MDTENKLNGKTVLVVEDERPLAEAIKVKLEKNGFEVLSARSIDQAIEYVDDKDIEKVDLIWLDHYLLGQKTGLDFVAYIRSSEGMKDLPIFVVTNTGGHDKKQTYLHLGANKYYVKADNKLNEIIDDIKTQTDRLTPQ